MCLQIAEPEGFQDEKKKGKKAKEVGKTTGHASDSPAAKKPPAKRPAAGSPAERNKAITDFFKPGGGTWHVPS